MRPEVGEVSLAVSAGFRMQSRASHDPNSGSTSFKKATGSALQADCKHLNPPRALVLRSGNQMRPEKLLHVAYVCISQSHYNAATIAAKASDVKCSRLHDRHKIRKGSKAKITGLLISRNNIEPVPMHMPFSNQ